MGTENADQRQPTFDSGPKVSGSESADAWIGVGDCSECPYGGPKVGISGDIESPIVIVGESPGFTEIRQGAPFVGESGKILWKHLAGLDREACLVLNALQCMPKKRKGKKDPKEMNKATVVCQDTLSQILRAHPRKYILALGNAAVWALTNNFGYKITQIRGTVLTCIHTGAQILPAVHPAAIMRGTSNYRQFKNDLNSFLDLVDHAHLKVAYKEPSYTLIDSPADIDEFHGLLGCDIETTGFDYTSKQIICAGIAYEDAEVDVLTKPLWPLEGEDTHQKLKEAFESPHCTYVWHGGKFDIKFLRDIGINARVDEDTMLLSYCLDEMGGVHDLEAVMTDWLRAPNYKNMLEKYLPNKKASYDVIPKDILYKYQAIDCAGTLQAFHKMRKAVSEDPHCEKLYTEVLIPANELLARVEMNGIIVDTDKLYEVGEDLQQKMATVNEQLNEVAGYDINPGSPAQMAKLFYDELHLRPIKGRTTSQDVLPKLPQIPAVELLVQYRKWSKRYGTYVKGILKFLEGSPDNRLHANFLLHGTRTGRLACRNPNLQNVPRGPLIRSCFVPPKDHVFVEVDLNQAELRSLAALSNDTALCEIYEDTDRSIHHEVAVDFFGKDYTSEEKMRAKAVNFGIVYGREAPSIAYEFGISKKEAQGYIDSWLNRFPQARDFIRACRKAPLRGQTIITAFGRKKRAQIVSRENMITLQNEAANFPHQSIASDINLMAAVRVEPKIRALGARINILVHDSIIFECPKDPKILHECIRLVIEAEESEAPRWGITRVPFKAEAKIGDDWGSLENYHGHEE